MDGMPASVIPMDARSPTIAEPDTSWWANMSDIASRMDRGRPRSCPPVSVSIAK